MKNYPKYKVKLWDKLWIMTYDAYVDVVLFDETELLHKWLKDKKKCPDCVPKDREFAGYALQMNSSHFVIFLKNKNLVMSTLVHECVHVRQMLFESIGMYDDCLQSTALKEAEAYFTGELTYQVLVRVKDYLLDNGWIISNYKVIKNERKKELAKARGSNDTSVLH